MVAWKSCSSVPQRIDRISIPKATALLDGAERTALLDLAELRRLMPERPDLAKFLGDWGVEPQKRG